MTETERKLSPEREAEFVAKYRTGRWTVRGLVPHYGISYELGRKILHRNSTTITRRPAVPMTMEFRQASGAKIRAIRLRSGMSTDQFARHLTRLAEVRRLPIEVAHATVRDWEKGRRVPEGDHAKLLEFAEQMAGGE